MKHEPLCRWTQEERKAEEGRLSSSLTRGLCSEKGQYMTRRKERTSAVGGLFSGADSHVEAHVQEF